jgi:hypothetical protein
MEPSTEVDFFFFRVWILVQILAALTLQVLLSIDAVGL